MAACGVQPYDPRQVVTPINPHKTIEILRTYNLLESFNDTVNGLIYGFDVGIKAPPTSTLLF